MTTIPSTLPVPPCRDSTNGPGAAWPVISLRGTFLMTDGPPHTPTAKRFPRRASTMTMTRWLAISALGALLVVGTVNCGGGDGADTGSAGTNGQTSGNA